MQVSKAFRCTIPGLRDVEARHVRRWAELHCAQSALFRNANGSVVLVGLKDELRTSASFARTVRTALRRMAIVVPLRGRWLTLTTPREVLAVVYDGKSMLGRIDAPQTAPVSEDDPDDRIVALC